MKSRAGNGHSAACRTEQSPLMTSTAAHSSPHPATLANGALLPVAIIGAGPAGLMAAQVLSQAGVPVHVLDAMPSAGRKFLLAGKGGLNLTHSEPLPAFISRYGAAAPVVADWLADFGPQALRDWAADLGVRTFVGSSGRVFPLEMKAAPLLRAWLQRLRQPVHAGAAPVRFHMRHRWLGWGAPSDAGRTLRFDTPEGPCSVQARATVLALGGASWPRLGSDGAWQPWLAQLGAGLAPLQAANCGFDVHGRSGQGWSSFLAQRFAGQPLKNVAIRVPAPAPGGADFVRQGEFVLTATGIEGSLIYAASALLRDEIARKGRARLWLDLLPARSPAQVLAAVAHPRGRRSLGAHLKSRLGLHSVHTTLLHELLPPATLADSAALAQAIKALPIDLKAPRPLAEAISTAGGVHLQALTPDLALRQAPDVFCAGEMLDWEAPTGGYLLTASMASGWRAGQGVRRYLIQK